MKITKTIGVFAFALILGVFAGLGFSNPFQSYAGVPIANEYKAVVVDSTSASATVPFVVATTTRTLGSVIVGTTGAQIIRIYDGIASTTAPQTATSSGRLIGTLKASVAEQTFDFDVEIVNGIIVDVPANFAGVYTVSHRR
jgi:hypothetical protein